MSVMGQKQTDTRKKEQESNQSRVDSANHLTTATAQRLRNMCLASHSSDPFGEIFCFTKDLLGLCGKERKEGLVHQKETGLFAFP